MNEITDQSQLSAIYTPSTPSMPSMSPPIPVQSSFADFEITPVSRSLQNQQVYAAYFKTSREVGAADVYPSGNVKAVVCIEHGWKIGEDYRGTKLLAVTHRDAVQVLQVVSVTALTVREQMAKQIERVMGPFAYRWVRAPPIAVPAPVYNGDSWKDVCSSCGVDESMVLRLSKGQQLPLQEFSEDFKSLVALQMAL
tara:strand:+ start:5827 stop:6414 length:588 start_codon:yes stop_codon:yes gene_type:complete